MRGDTKMAVTLLRQLVGYIKEQPQIFSETYSYD